MCQGDNVKAEGGKLKLQRTEAAVLTRVISLAFKHWLSKEKMTPRDAQKTQSSEPKPRRMLEGGSLFAQLVRRCQCVQSVRKIESLLLPSWQMVRAAEHRGGAFSNRWTPRCAVSNNHLVLLAFTLKSARCCLHEARRRLEEWQRAPVRRQSQAEEWRIQGRL